MYSYGRNVAIKLIGQHFYNTIHTLSSHITKLWDMSIIFIPISQMKLCRIKLRSIPKPYDSKTRT